MTSNCSFLVAGICALPLTLAACGGSSDSTITPEGTHHSYVVSKASVPATDPQVREFGLDLGAKTSATPDGTIDNALGSTLSALAALNFDVQGTVTTAVDTGSIILVLDFQTKDFTNASASGLAVKLGTAPTPAACSSPTDTVCRHHLDGSASFKIAADSPNDPAIAGKIVNGTFTGGPGDLTLQIAIGSATAPIKLDLLHARAKVTGISDTGITSAIIGGLVLQTDLMTSIGPAIQAQIVGILDRDCKGARNPPACGCTAGTTGATVIGALDGKSAGSVADCQITTEEVLGFPVVKALLQPDSCSTDTCAKADALGVGIKVEAVKATF
jgi:hypothetical protein